MPFSSSWAWLKRLHARTDAADLFMIAAGMAFYGLLSIFPAVAAVIAIWGFVADPVVIRGQLELARDFLPGDAFSLISTQVDSLLATNSRDLGWATLVSTMLALWSCRAGVASLITGINTVHHLPARSGVMHVIRALFLTITLVGVVLSAMVLAVVMPVVIRYLPLGYGQSVLLESLNFALGLALVVFGIALVYRLGPNRPAGEPRPVFTRGLLMSVLLWALISRGFVFYLSNFHSYNQVYGSIGAVIALLMWMYLSGFAILLGAAVDADHAARRHRRQ
ncbi:YihY/virulence factor BrkB family protein [Falsirhodobacter halotolerans]|uniref:YihY/virulence factor BrkB family protein n=1 Tax=Falsirhodobacter halotolerans TaxID=1146892 RepID=UPI001FD52FC0|nr:YihY/virulence factor BrkB family protein [Falsirhodobacter halotolerans]MCJ8138338.1 YihY/virulence factor BrkB family protein [Falsirhodobacter halotolerans]